MKGHVSFVGAGPGDPDLITVRGLRVLQQADVVLYDNLIDLRVLEAASGQLIYVGKRCGKHSLKQEQINDLIIDIAAQGKYVARLKGGDPTIFGRVGEEALHCVRHKVAFDIVPGISSAYAAAAYAGIPVTHRGVADSFCVVAAHRRGDELEFSIPKYNPRTTVILMMGVGTVESWRQTLGRNGYPDDLPAAFVVRGTWPDQRVIVTTVGELAQVGEDDQLTTPAVAVIGHAVGLREKLEWFESDSSDSSDVPMPDTAQHPRGLELPS